MGFLGTCASGCETYPPAPTTVSIGAASAARVYRVLAVVESSLWDRTRPVIITKAHHCAPKEQYRTMYGKNTLNPKWKQVIPAIEESKQPFEHCYKTHPATACRYGLPLQLSNTLTSDPPLVAAAAADVVFFGAARARLACGELQEGRGSTQYSNAYI